MATGGRRRSRRKVRDGDTPVVRAVGTSRRNRGLSGDARSQQRNYNKNRRFVALLRCRWRGRVDARGRCLSQMTRASSEKAAATRRLADRSPPSS